MDSAKNPRGQNSIWIYSPAKDSWRRFEVDLPEKWVSPGAREIDDTLYVFGGGYNNWWPAKSDCYALDLTSVKAGSKCKSIVSSETPAGYDEKQSCCPHPKKSTAKTVALPKSPASVLREGLLVKQASSQPLARTLEGPAWVSRG